MGLRTKTFIIPGPENQSQDVPWPLESEMLAVLGIEPKILFVAPQEENILPPTKLEEVNEKTITPEEVQNLPQAQADVSLEYLIMGGHNENLVNTSYGLTAHVDSTPRDLGISSLVEHIINVFLPTQTRIEQPSIPTEQGCQYSVDINVQAFVDNEIDDILSNSQSALFSKAFTFTFEAHSDGSTDLVFLINQAGFSALEANEASFNLFDSDTVSFSPFVIPIINDGDCGVTSCNNPIVSVLATEVFADVVTCGGGSKTTLFTDYDGLQDFFSNKAVFLAQDGSIFQLSNPSLNVYELDVVCPQPIVLDLNNHGFELTSSSTSNVLLNLNGVTAHSGWIGPDNGFLTYNYSGTGPIIESNYILTQNVTGAKTDLQALRLLANQQDGMLDATNAIWNKLGVWQDSDQNGAMDKGEYHTLGQLGIVSIGLTESGPVQHVNGNTLYGIMSFTYSDGTTGKAADVALSYQDIVTASHTIAGVSETVPATTSITTVVDPVVVPLHIDPVVQAAVDAAQHTVTSTGTT